MKPFVVRPLFTAALFMITGMLIAAGPCQWLILPVSILTFAVFLLRMVRWKARPGCMFFFLLLLVGYLAMVLACRLPTMTSLIQSESLSPTGSFTGTITKIRHTDYGVRYYLKKADLSATVNDTVYTEKSSCLLLYDNSTSEALYHLGDTLSGTATLEAFCEATNPGEFDLRLYYSTQKIYLQATAESVCLKTRCQNPLIRLADACATGLDEVYSSIAGEKSAAVFKAMVLGNRDELDEELSDLFSICGIGHILAISGLHISLLGMSLYRLLRRAGLPCIPAMLLGGVLILFYGLMTGNGVSTVRALIMFLACIFADAVKKSYDLLSAASLAAILMLLDSPKLLYHSGFLLSYSAVLGIGLVSPALTALFPGKNRLLRNFLGSLSIQLMTTPVTLYFYYRVPTLAVFLNMLVIPLMTVVMISALAGGIGGLLDLRVGTFMIGPAVYIVRFYEWLCRWNVRIPYASITAGQPKLWQMLIYYGLLALFLLVCRIRPKRPAILLPVAGFIVLLNRFDPRLQVTFLDVGQGDGIYIRTPSKLSVLIDGGSTTKTSLYDKILEPFLLSEGVTKLDYCIITHPDEDHVSGVLTLLQEGEISVKTLLLPEPLLVSEECEELVLAAEEAQTEVVGFYTGMTITSGDVTFECLHPDPDYEAEDMNGYSTSLMVRYGTFALLSCGDIGSAEEELLQDVLVSSAPFTVVKANHHGSRYSNTEAFYQSCLPEYTVISCGLNNSYGHPTTEALEHMEAVGTQILRTDLQGAVRFYTNGKNVKMRLTK